MLFTIEKYAIRVGSKYLRRCFCKNVGIAVNNTQEFILQPEDNFTSIRREGQKSLKIAILGAPNVGKSSLVNQLIKRSVIIILFIHLANVTLQNLFLYYISLYIFYLIYLCTIIYVLCLFLNRYAQHLLKCILRKPKLMRFTVKMILN